MKSYEKIGLNLILQQEEKKYLMLHKMHKLLKKK
jgi:hypothetical protein